MVSDKQAVLKTLKYGDLFDCPQTEAEIEKFLIKEVGKEKLKKILNSSPEILSDSGYFCLKGRKKIIATKKKREKESLFKIEKAKKLSFLLSKIPSIILLGVSGSVATKNANKADDIDLFIITSKNTLWTTRFLMVTFFKLIKKYRKKGDRNVRDKFCLNMFLTEESMSFNKDKRNIYTAREICQLVPIFQREDAYNNFLNKNGWVKEYLPNARVFLKKENKKLINGSKSISGKFILSILENPMRDLQMKKIRKNLTMETITYNFAAFHPKDVMNSIIERYSKYPGVFTTRGY